MNCFWKAAGAAVLLLVSLCIEIGCGDTYRPIATPSPVTTGNPSGAETEAVLNQPPTSYTSTATSSIVTAINVSGDTNMGDKTLANTVGSAVLGTVSGSGAASTVNIPNSPMAFNYARTGLYTANTTTDSVTQLSIASSTAGFAANTTTLSLNSGSAPTAISFQYEGASYSKSYVVNSGAGSCGGSGGSLGVLDQSTVQIAATVCLPTVPVAAWIYKDQTKVFVIDNGNPGTVYVVNATSNKITNTLSVGPAPIKIGQSANGQYIYVLNAGTSAGTGSLTIIDGQAEVVVGTLPITAISSAQPIDMALDLNYSDTTANSQYNHIWILQADGTVNVYDATNITVAPHVPTWYSSISTITSAQLAAGAYPTNLALMRDGSYAYVGVGNTDQLVAINTSQLISGTTTGSSALTSVTVGIHRNVTQALSYTYTQSGTSNTLGPYTGTVPVEVTTPTVLSVAVSRGGSSADLSKAYATTSTKTVYYCYDYTVTPTSCLNGDPWTATTMTVTDTSATPTTSGSFLGASCTDNGNNTMTCADLYNGTSVVAAAANGSITVNSYITTVNAPTQVTYCNAATTAPDAQKACPRMVPTTVLGRS